MARKVIDVTISAPGRDFGKVFRITELPTAQSEKWAIRLFLALANSGIEIPEGIENAGLAGVISMGVRALSGLKFDLAEPLLEEMFSCVQIVPDPKRPTVVRALVEDDIEEIVTRLITLRKEIITVHTGFSFPAALSDSEAPATGESSPVTPMSRVRSPR